jgi:hypothetical protein
LVHSAFLDRAWVAREEKLRDATQSDKPAYSDEIHRHIRYNVGSRSANMRPSGPLRVNNGDAMMPTLIAGTFAPKASFENHALRERLR